jgi:hypothetical protein
LQLQKSPSRVFGQNSGNSDDISKAFFGMGISKFESSQVSQPVRLSEKRPLIVAEMPAVGGLLRFRRWSPDSRFSGLRGEIAESLRPYSELFPFLGDGGRRPGSICTAWSVRQCHSLWCPTIWTKNREFSIVHCHEGAQNRGFYELAIGLQAPDLATLSAKTLRVSGPMPDYSGDRGGRLG